MKIIFNMLGTGLGNNGGSKTIIRSAEVLRDLGHDVLICSKKNSCTWWQTKVHITKALSPCDVLIATGYGSVASTSSYKEVRLKLWYIRAHENWVVQEKYLMRAYRQLKCIANSEWIVNWLGTHGIDCELVYPGLDLGCYHVSTAPRLNMFGGLQHKHARKRSHDCLKVEELSGYGMKMLNRDFSGGDFGQLSRFYNQLKIWMSPSENEGIQNVPMEAALCGCGLVLTDHFMGGTVDYAVDEETCLIYPARDLEAASECITRLMKDEDLRKNLNKNSIEVIRSKIGNRKTNMIKFLDFLNRTLQ